MHKIKKYQTPWGNGIQPVQTSDINFQNLDSLLGSTYKNLFSQPKKMNITSDFSKMNSNLQSLPTDLSGFKTSDINIKPIGSALAEDSARQTRLAGTANKTSLINGMSTYGNLAGDISSMLPEANNNLGTNAINKGTDAISDALMNPAAIAATGGMSGVVGGAIKIAGLANKGLSAITGGATTINDASNIGDQVLSSNIMGFTPIGLVNSLTKTKVAGSNQALANSAASSAYGASDVSKKTEIGGVSNFFNKLFGGKDLVKSKSAITNSINTENAQKALNLKTNNFQNLARTQGIQNVGLSNQSELNNFDTSKILLSKEGSKLDKLKKDKRDIIQQRSRPNAQKDVNEFAYNTTQNKTDIKVAQHGTQMETETPIETMEKGDKVNVIPSGALHAHKNHLEIGGITSKGIPVITAKGQDGMTVDTTEKLSAMNQEKGGEITQHAEIEREELIIHIGLTQQLEKLRKEGTKEATLAAGKLLAQELMENVDDRTGLTDKLLNNEN